jgi:hypothetical protein
MQSWRHPHRRSRPIGSSWCSFAANPRGRRQAMTVGSINNYSWLAYQFWRFVFVQQEVAKAAQTFLEFPPMQKGVSFNLEALKQELEKKMASHSAQSGTSSGGLSSSSSFFRGEGRRCLEHEPGLCPGRHERQRLPMRAKGERPHEASASRRSATSVCPRALTRAGSRTARMPGRGAEHSSRSTSQRTIGEYAVCLQRLC